MNSREMKSGGSGGSAEVVVWCNTDYAADQFNNEMKNATLHTASVLH